MLSESQKNKLIQAAIYSPSADNSQPFKYHWRDGENLELWIDKNRSGKASDNRFVLSDIALGAVIENVCITGHSLNVNTHVTYLPDEDNQPLHVANITFTSTESNEHYDRNLAEAIPNRCTDRRFPFKGPILPESIEAMSQEAEKYGATINWYTDKQSIKKILPVIQKAESIRFKSQTLHQELFSTVSFNNKAADEGMPISVLAIEKIAQPMFKLMKNWSIMKVVNKIGGANLLGFRSVRVPIIFSPALALIKIENNKRLSVIKGGRAIQRFWLQATHHGLAIQPYAAPGIFSLGFVECETEHKKALHAIAEDMSDIVNQKGYGLMFLRIGMNKEVIHKTNRRNITSFDL